MPSSEDAVLIDVVTEDGRRTFAVFETQDPPYQLRHSDIPWRDGFSNSIPSMRLHYKARIIPDIVRNLGHAFHTWLMVVLICRNLVYHPNESRSEPPMLVYPFRFSSKRRADVALEFFCATWLPLNMYHVHISVLEHMLSFGYRQDTVGHWPIWFGPLSAMSLKRYPFNPTHRSLPVRCRSRLYHDRYYLRDCHELLSVGLSQEEVFPGADSAGLGLFADISADETIPLDRIRVHQLVFTVGTIICRVRNPHVRSSHYNSHRGYHSNRYMCWSLNHNIVYDGSSLRSPISYANDSLATGHWNARLYFGVDPLDGRHKWMLVAIEDIYTSQEITYQYDWKYWAHLSSEDLQLFAWRRYYSLDDPDARAVNVGLRFAWVNQYNAAFDFQRYAECSNYEATRIPPRFWHP